MSEGKNNTKNVSTTRGVKGGYANIAPAGTKLPVGFEPLDPGFDCMGFFGEDGWKEGVDASSENVLDMNGDPVDSYSESATETIAMTLLEMAVNPLRVQYGDKNVTDGEDMIIVKHNWSNADDEWSIVLDLLLKNGRKWRKVIPVAKVSDRGEVTGNSKTPTGREVTLTYMTEGSDGGCIDYIEKLKETKETGEAETQALENESSGDFSSMTVSDLKEYAANNGIDISGLTKRDDILSAITAAESAKEGN